MTPEQLDAAIAEIIIPQVKPRSTQNSHRRKQWDNDYYWRLCTIGETCKLGVLKQIFDGKLSYEVPLELDRVQVWSGLCWISRTIEDRYYSRYSYNRKYKRRTANRHVRRYAGDIGNHNFYRRIFEYQWSCI